MTTIFRDRGRYAESPKEIPPKGWKDTLLRVKAEIKDDHLSMISASMAFYILLALVPALTSVVLIYAWISDPAEISNHLSSVSSILPKEVQTVLTQQLTALANKGNTALGFGAIFSLLFSLWSASKSSKALIEALNIIYEENDQRGFFKQNGLALFLTFLAAVLSIVAIGVVVGLPAMSKFLELGAAIEVLISVVSWILLLGLFSFFLSYTYRYGPHRNIAKWKWVSPGALIASVLWAVVSLLFTWYASEFGNFNKTYGSMGAIIVVMLWFYLSSFVVLIGGEINAELEHQTKKDTTKGRPKPMGHRKAKMADTLGRSFGK